MEKLIIEDTVPTFEEFYNSEARDTNNFSYWYPKVKDLFLTPKTECLKLSKSIAESLVNYYEKNLRNKSDSPKTKELLDYFNTVVLPAAQKVNSNSLPFVFIKNARFSNKFDFNKSCECRPTAQDLLESIANINYASMCCDALGFTEIVLREYLPYDEERVYTIYQGMPLKPEYRVFYNFDTSKVVHIHDYWDYDYVYEGLHSKNDKLILRESRDEREFLWNYYKPAVEREAEKLRKVKGLNGIWSFDFLIQTKENASRYFEQVDADKIYLIDAAVGRQSAYYREEFESE